MPQRNPLLRYATPPEPGTTLDGARSLPLALIDPNPTQARQSFDTAALDELAASITAHGVIEPVVVRPVGDRYQIVAGERRTRAARLAGLASIPAIIRDLTDEQAAYLTAVENLQREDLDIEDEARYLQYLFDVTPAASYRKIGDLIGKSHVYVLRRLQLLDHPELFQQIRTGALTQRAALQQLEPPTEGPVVHGVPDAPSIVERATLDRPAASSDRLVRTPWRDRPLTAFMDWVARVDVTTLPAQDRARAREQLAAAREWVTRLELQLGDEE